MNSIISQVMALFGITSAPVTVSDFLWDLIILVVGLFIVKSHKKSETVTGAEVMPNNAIT